MSVDPTALESDLGGLGPLQQDIGGNGYVDLSVDAGEGDSYFSTFSNFTPLENSSLSNVNDAGANGLLPSGFARKCGHSWPWVLFGHYSGNLDELSGCPRRRGGDFGTFPTALDI